MHHVEEVEKEYENHGKLYPVSKSAYLTSIFHFHVVAEVGVGEEKHFITQATRSKNNENR